jgi:hypothetical protein
LRTDLYFRISVIDAGLQLKSHLEQYQDVSVDDAIRQLRAGPVSRSTLDYESVLNIDGLNGLSLFCPSVSRTEELRETIFKMATRLKPFWAKVSPFGRDRVSAIMSSDQIQCLRYAELLDSTDEPVWRWWDKLAANFRSEKLDRLTEIGRMGEQLSLRLEMETLKKLGISKAPRWISLDDNLAGYDILSYRPNVGNGETKAFIEVKATYSADRAFFLTRREWDFAERSGSAFEFHFWHLPDQSLYRATVNEVSKSIPLDRGLGRWDQALLRLSDEAFQSIDLQ